MQEENPVSLLFRSRLQTLLEEHGITQRQLALATGISQQSVNNYVRGVTKLPGAEELLALARYFDLPMESFLLPVEGLGGKGILTSGKTATAGPHKVSAAEVHRAAGRMRWAAEELLAEAERLERLGSGNP